MADDIEHRGMGDGHPGDFEAALAALIARLCIISADVRQHEDEPCDTLTIPLAA